MLLDYSPNDVVNQCPIVSIDDQIVECFKVFEGTYSDGFIASQVNVIRKECRNQLTLERNRIKLKSIRQSKIFSPSRGNRNSADHRGLSAEKNLY